MMRFLVILILMTLPNTGYPGNLGLGEKCNDLSADPGCAEGFECLRIERKEAVCYKTCETDNNCFSAYEGPNMTRCRADPMQAFNVQDRKVCVIVCGGIPLCGINPAMCTGECPGIMNCLDVFRPQEMITRPKRCQ